MARIALSIFAGLLFPLLAFTQDHGSSNDSSGRMIRAYWHQSGIEHGNPAFNNRVRVNGPQAVLHPSFGRRSEVRGNGMIQILIDEDLSLLDGAELYLELWGGHPGTANKRVAINGRATYPLPETGTVEGHCTHNYPTLSLNITDLVNGYNVLQFACDEGESFWGHYIVENACLKMILKPDHPDLREYGLDQFAASVEAKKDKAKVELSINAKQADLQSIEAIAYQGYYTGYDENGDGAATDWHGFTKDKTPVAYLGTLDDAAASLVWDTSDLPAQQFAQAKAIIQFTGQTNLLYETKPAPIYFIGNHHARLYGSHDMPAPFWSRANNEKTCTIHLDMAPGQIKRAELRTVAWDGGRGEVDDYFTINGHAVNIAGEGKHDVLYKQIEIDPTWLKKGKNEIRLLSDTEHHGIEILRPGPALLIETKAN